MHQQYRSSGGTSIRSTRGKADIRPGDRRESRSASEDGGDNPFLTRLRLLTDIGDTDLAALERLCANPRQFGGRAELVADGEPQERLHILLDGWACRSRLLADGRRQITTLLLPGDICDLDGLYVRNSDCSVATLTPCSVAAVSRPAIQDLAVRSRDVADALGWLGAVENAMLAERNACLGQRSAEEHLAHFLCELLMRLTVVGRASDFSYTLPLTQEAMADVLGLTSVHINRVLHRLRASELIEQRGNQLEIRDWDSLRRVAGFRPDYLHLEGLNGAGDVFAAAPWIFAAPSQPMAPGFSHA